MLEALFAHQSQEQAFLAFLVCGLVLGLGLHIGAALRNRVVCTLWEVLTALGCIALAFLVLLRFGTGLRAYALLGILLGVLLYLAGLAQVLREVGKLFQKYKNSRLPKAGESTPDDESTVQKDAKE